MGLNLPVHRIIFMSTEKFDGTELRPLLVSEVKQIAGRAGKYGIYKEEYVSAVGKDRGLIKRNLNIETPIIDKAFIGFSEKLLIINIDLLDIMKVWQGMKSEFPLYEKQDISVQISLLSLLKNYATGNNIRLENVNKKTIYNLTTVTFDKKNDNIKYMWLDYCEKYLSGDLILNKPVYPTSISFQNMETYYKELDLYYSFGSELLGNELPSIFCCHNNKFHNLKLLPNRVVHRPILLLYKELHSYF